MENAGPFCLPFSQHSAFDLLGKLAFLEPHGRLIAPNRNLLEKLSAQTETLGTRRDMR